jgi:AcrR family transcriptional regulator
MNEPVKGSRPYNSARRAARAAENRTAILESARKLIEDNGYHGTSIAQIATAAGVAVDTVYASVGRKPALMRELVETALSGSDRPVAGPDRDYAGAMRAAESAAEMLQIYATAVSEMQPRLVPVFAALREASSTDADCAALWSEISTRRAKNMRLLAADLRSKGDVRDDMGDGDVADAIWSMNGPEYWLLLVGDRGWSVDRYRRWLTDVWCRTLLVI